MEGDVERSDHPVVRTGRLSFAPPNEDPSHGPPAPFTRAAVGADGRRQLAFVLANRSSAVFCFDIHPAARIGAGVMLDHGSGSGSGSGSGIGETAVVDGGVSILQNVTLGGTGKERGIRHPQVRSGVMIGAGAKILGSIEIGAMSKVAAGSVVLEPVPAHCTVAGVPARIVRRHEHARLPAMDMDQSLPS
jgi:serine O-acetyltransferase